MASLQAHLLDILVRVKFKRRMNRNTELTSVRRTLESGNLPVQDGVTFTPDVVGGISGEWARPVKPPIATLLYLHGGGYIACSSQTHRPITAAYASRGFQVFVPNYRLAPEHPFPAALDDAKAVWLGLEKLGYPGKTLTLSGDSAGGGLCLALMLMLRDQPSQLPAAAALFSPWTDLAGTGRSVISNARRDAMFWAPGLVSAGAFYLKNEPPTNPLASPNYADLHGLPPLLIHVGDREILRDDSVRLAERATAAGTEVTIRIWPVVPHVWQLVQALPEARLSMDIAASFLLGRLPV